MRLNSPQLLHLTLSLLLFPSALVSRGLEPESDPAHCDRRTEKPLPWPDGVLPYDISKLTPEQGTNALRAMQLWMDTGAKIKFIPRTTEPEYVYFTGKTDAGNNTPFNGFRQG